LNLEYFIARKVAASGQKSFSRLIIRIAITAVALSVAVMIIATALIAGFKYEISNKIFGFWGHIHITDTDINRSLLDAYPVKKNQTFYPSLDTVRKITYLDQTEVGGVHYEQMRTTKGGVDHIQVFAMIPVIVKGKKDIEGIVLKGISDDFEWKYMDQFMVEGERIVLPDSSASKDIIISQQTARRLDVKTGDNFDVVFVRKNEQLRRRFVISGIYKTGLEEYDKRFALVDIRQLQRLLGWTENEVGGFEVFIDDIDDLSTIVDYIYYDQLPNDLLKKKLPEIFDWLELQDINGIVILSLMVIVAIINMVTALMILILERTNMIGTLKAMGSSNWSIRKVFLYYAAYIVIIGLFWGNLFGIGICVLQDQLEIIRLSEENYYLSVAPIKMNFWTILGINTGTLITTVLFLVIPSYLVSSISPVKAIRFK
jgi:lipoprotein-releasing system permease protein